MKLIKLLACAVFTLAFQNCETANAATQDPALVQRLSLTARVWGLAKFHHPDVVACRRNWDKALIDTLPAVYAANDSSKMDLVMANLLQLAGAPPAASSSSNGPAWINASALSATIKQQLNVLSAQRPSQQCYVKRSPDANQANFDTDIGYIREALSLEVRILGAFRFWNAIEYFFPYKNLIGRDWEQVLTQHLPRLIDANSPDSYALAMRAFSAEINDTHAFQESGTLGFIRGIAAPPFNVRKINNQWIVERSSIAARAITPGDKLIRIDTKTVAARELELLPTVHGSNPAARLWILEAALLGGFIGEAEFEFERLDGSRYVAVQNRSLLNFSLYGLSATRPAWEQRTLAAGCKMGVIDMSQLKVDQIESMLSELRNSDALIFDQRNYPNGTLWPLVDRLFSSTRVVAQFGEPQLDAPGQFSSVSESFGGANPIGYRGKLIVLVDESSLSQAEYTAMGLQAYGNTMIVGSQTAAADGNITGVSLPGNNRILFSGLSVFYPDGRQTQRLGIVPDLHVFPTMQGIRAGKDEVLDAALDCRWVNSSPPSRRPEAGLFWQQDRAGEGYDLHTVRDDTIGLSYGYDADGNSNWLYAENKIVNGIWNGDLADIQADGSLQNRARIEMDFQRGPYTPTCAIEDQSRMVGRATLTITPSNFGASGCIEPLSDLRAGIHSGLYAPIDTERWGVSIHHLGDTLFVIVYGFDNNRKQRWLLGSGLINNQNQITIELNRYQGFCRDCAASPITPSLAGQMTIDIPNGTATEMQISIDAKWLSNSDRFVKSNQRIVRLTSN